MFLKVQCCSYGLLWTKTQGYEYTYLCIVVDVLIIMNYIWKDYWLWSFVKSILTMIKINDLKKNIMSGPVVTRNISTVALVLEHYFLYTSSIIHLHVFHENFIQVHIINYYTNHAY